MHVFLYFQHSPRRPGNFTINIVFSNDDRTPDREVPIDRKDAKAGHPGSCRIGEFVLTCRGDKWWVLKRDEEFEELSTEFGSPSHENEDWWYSGSYENEENVISTALADVNRDVKTVLKKLVVASS